MTATSNKIFEDQTANGSLTLPWEGGPGYLSVLGVLDAATVTLSYYKGIKSSKQTQLVQKTDTAPVQFIAPPASTLVIDISGAGASTNLDIYVDEVRT